MAFTERYVTATASGGDGSIGSPWTWAEALANAVVGDRINVKKGAYSRAALDAPTTAGTSSQPIVVRGYNSSIGDLANVGRTNGTGALITTDFPVVTYDATYRLNATGAGAYWWVWETIKFVGNVSNYVVSTYTGGVCYRCAIVNSSTNAAAGGFSGTTAIDCDVDLTGGSGTAAALTTAIGKIIGCHVLAAPNNGITVTNGYSVVAYCVVDDCGNDGIVFASTTASHVPPLFIGNTVYSCGGDAISIGNYNYTGQLFVINNHLCESTGYAVNSDYDGTGQLSCVFANNRLLGTGNGILINGFDGADSNGWAQGTSWGHVVTDGAASLDFNDAPGGDFRLKSAAGAKAVGLKSYQDIGALQRQEPTYPAAGDVHSTAAAYGDTLSQTTPTCVLPPVEDVESGVQYGAGGTEFTGTLSGGAGGGFPILGGSIVR